MSCYCRNWRKSIAISSHLRAVWRKVSSWRRALKKTHWFLSSVSIWSRNLAQNSLKVLFTKSKKLTNILLQGTVKKGEIWKIAWGRILETSSTKFLHIGIEVPNKGVVGHCESLWAKLQLQNRKIWKRLKKEVAVKIQMKNWKMNWKSLRR